MELIVAGTFPLRCDAALWCWHAQALLRSIPQKWLQAYPFVLAGRYRALCTIQGKRRYECMSRAAACHIWIAGKNICHNLEGVASLDERDADLGNESPTPFLPEDAIPGAAHMPVARLAPRRTGLRLFLMALGVATLVAALVSGSVVTARSMEPIVPFAPASTVTPYQDAWQIQSDIASSVNHAAKAPCDCSSKHRSYTPAPYQPMGAGQVVVVSLSKQQLWAFQDGQLVMTALVTTGRPELPTPAGTYHIMQKETNVWFYSPWPYGSPYYYSPEFIPYAMLFRAGGYYIHAAPWRETFGPGTNVPHTEPDGTWATGSHGCVNMATNTAAQLYSWIQIGATVVIQY